MKTITTDTGVYQVSDRTAEGLGNLHALGGETGETWSMDAPAFTDTGERLVEIFVGKDAVFAVTPAPDGDDPQPDRGEANIESIWEYYWQAVYDRGEREEMAYEALRQRPLNPAAWGSPVWL